MHPTRFLIRRLTVTGLAIAGAADAADAADFRWRRRPPLPVVCVPYQVCPTPLPLCPPPVAVPCVVQPGVANSSTTARSSADQLTTPAWPRQSVLDADIPPG
jgi:hypothetical protein